MLRVLTPARRRTLLETTSTRDRLGVGSDKDSAIALLIADATGVLESRLGRTLARQRYEESLRSDGQLFLRLSAVPVEPGLTVTRDGTVVSGVYIENRGAGVIGVGLDTGFGGGGGFGWPSTSGVAGLFADYEVPGSGPRSYVVTFWAGYLLPGAVADWSSGAKTAGSWARAVTEPNTLRFEVTTAGTTAGTEPDWSSASAGDTIEDGGVMWTAREALELPQHLQRACWLTVRHWWFEEGLRRDPGVREKQRGDKRIAWGTTQQRADSLPDEVLALLEQEVAA